MSVSDNLHKIGDNLPETVKLVAVSKFHPIEAIQEAYDAGQRIFGESRMQEINEKQKELPQDIQWHFIGHLQTNKVKTIVSYTHTIHSIDSWNLLQEVEKQATNMNKRICCLLEIHIAEEKSKYGLSFDSCRQLLKDGLWKQFRHAYIGGVMGMATYTDDKEQVRKEFRNLRLFHEELKNNYFSGNELFTEISMGMSDDYAIAVEEGSTIVRIGSSIFGQREY
jgi:pyridoxal phosphate enzyme (YggS family)